MKHAFKSTAFAVAILVCGNAFAATELETLKSTVQTLMDRIEQLEAAEKARLVEAEKIKEARDVEKVSAAKKEARKQYASTPDSSGRVSSGNPSISVIGNFTGQRIRGSGDVRSSSFLPLSEAEFIFGANIDPHARLDVTVTAADGNMAVEEGFITAYLPWSTNLKAGRKFLPVGRVNEQHPHALVYADRPNGLVNLFGPEIFIGDGLLLDRPFFIGESVHTVTAGLFSTQNDVAFDPTGANQYAGLVRWTGLWDMNGSTTFELGGNYIQGKNGIAGNNPLTRIAGVHFALKNETVSHSGFALEGEWLRRWQQQGAGVATSLTDGSYLLATAALNRDWKLFSRLDYSRELNTALSSWNSESAVSIGGVWNVSEFQNLTLQYKHTRNALTEVAKDLGIAAGGKANAWYLRWVVAIGPHGAHGY